MPFTDPYVPNPFPYSVACTLPSAATSPSTSYNLTTTLVTGVYTISWTGGGTLNIDFYNAAGTLITSSSGTSSITVNLAQQATYLKLWTTVGGITVVISLTALAVAPVSGTLYTYTSSQNIPLVGEAYVILVGGGGGSSSASGGSGGVISGGLTLTGVAALTIGAAGTPGISGSSNGTAGGTTSLLTLSASGGGGTSGATGATPGAAGSPNGVAGVFAGAGSATSSAATISGWPFMNMGTTGSGGGSSTGGGSGIGTGGLGNNAEGAAGGAATGYGASGGGGANAKSGGASTPGICYIVI